MMIQSIKKNVVLGLMLAMTCLALSPTVSTAAEKER